jgi:hypothetical protein
VFICVLHGVPTLVFMENAPENVKLSNDPEVTDGLSWHTTAYGVEADGRGMALAGVISVYGRGECLYVVPCLFGQGVVCGVCVWSGGLAVLCAVVLT